MLKIGLTGGIGSGKSSAAEIFSSLGITVIDADQIAHQLTQFDSNCLNEIKQQFGEEFITSNGELDRKKMAQSIFSETSKKNSLEKILHPKIKQRMLQAIEEIRDAKYIVLEIPLLFECDFIDLVDRIAVIDAEDETRMKRIQQRDGRSKEQIWDIMNQQVDQEHRLLGADDIIDNNGNLVDLHDAITQLHQQYMKISA